MLRLNELEKLTKKRKRVGRGGKRGRYSGHGRGGQKSRTGSSSELRASFEGGQMPLIRRVPRRGFTNVFKIEYKVVNLQELETKFSNGDTVNQESLRQKGIVKGDRNCRIKVLGTGTLTKKLVVTISAISATASQAIQNAGGSVQLL